MQASQLLPPLTTQHDLYGRPYTFSPEYINGVHYINIVYQNFGEFLSEDFSKQKEFINRFLKPVNFTFVQVIENAFWGQHIHLLMYKTHVSTDEHDCDECGCDDWCIMLSDVHVQLMIKHNIYRKVEFTKEHFMRVYNHFVPIFNVMRLAVTSSRSIVTLKELFTRTPNWCERLRTNFDAIDMDMFPYVLFSPMFSYSPFFSHLTHSSALPLCKSLLKKVNDVKIQRKQAVVKKVQDQIHMRAIPRILLIVPMGVNPYAEYVTRFIRNVDLYDMMYKSKFEIPVINGEQKSVSTEASLSLDPDDTEHSFMTFFSRDSDNSNMFYIIARRTRLDPALDILFNTHSKEARRASMKKVFDMFFERSLAVHLEQINQLTVFDSCQLNEESFKALFDVYINVSMSDATFKDMTDTNVIHLAYLAEIMGDKKMVLQILDYYLGFRFEYLYRVWKLEIPSLSPDLKMPDTFKRYSPDMRYGPNYGWDENGRDA